MVQELAQHAEGQGRRDDAEEAHRVHHPARAQGVQPAEPAAGEDEVRHQVVRERAAEQFHQQPSRPPGADGR